MSLYSALGIFTDAKMSLYSVYTVNCGACYPVNVLASRKYTSKENCFWCIIPLLLFKLLQFFIRMV